jgi:anti-anti-sigma regulatory factor
VNKESIYKVCATNNEVYVQIREKASYLNCAPLRSFLHEMVNEGNRVFVVDFQNCSSMDSTFLGILVGLGFAIKKISRWWKPYSSEFNWKKFRNC